MTVTVDHEPLEVIGLGLHTVGQVLAHLQKDNRMVVQVLVDGQEPAPGQIGALRETRLADHAIFIETADPRVLAMEVLDESSRQLQNAEQSKTEAAELLQQNQTGKAMEQLSACIRAWQGAQESITKVAELLRIDLNNVMVQDQPLLQMLADFSAQLRQIKDTLEQRDFVALGDVLLYETAQTTQRWLASISAMEQIIKQIR